MNGKTFFWSVGVWVLVLALVTSAAAQGRSREHFRGIISDFTPATTVKPSGPWELHGVCRTLVSGPSATSVMFEDLGPERCIQRLPHCQLQTSDLFGAPASGHFGSQPINGALRVRK
jgi:hypothetical protein